MREADLLLAIGARLGEMTTSGYTLLEPPRAARRRWCTCMPGAEELGRVYRSGDLLIAGVDVGCGAALECDGRSDDVAAGTSGQRRARATTSRQPGAARRCEPLDMAEVIRTVQRLSCRTTRSYTNGAGNFSGWLHRFCQYHGLQHHGRTQLAPTSGAMGYGVPAAVAASLLHPERTVVNVAGDGDFLMTGQELATAPAYGARRLICIVVDNGMYGTIRMHQEREYPARVSGTDLANPDFAALRAGVRRGTASGRDAPRSSRRRSSGRSRRASRRCCTCACRPDVSTSRTTLTAIRDSALERQR